MDKNTIDAEDSLVIPSSSDTLFLKIFTTEASYDVPGKSIINNRVGMNYHFSVSVGIK